MEKQTGNQGIPGSVWVGIGILAVVALVVVAFYMDVVPDVF